MELHDRVELDEALDFRTLVQGGDVTFSVKDMGDEDKEDYELPEDVFDRDALLNSVNMDTVEVMDDINGLPFDAIKANMTKVNPDGTVMKKVLRQGTGDVMSPDSLVRIHYAGYFEFNEVPFDSTYLRGKSFEFVLGCSGVVPGLDIAVASMRNQEKAQFIIHPTLAFGKLGCPPRILPNAEVLFVVEVMRWSLGSEAAVARATSNVHGEKSWEKGRPAFKALLTEGINLYYDNRFQDSKAKLEKAKKLIDNCHLKNEEEEKDFNRCLAVVSLNLAMVLNKLQGHLSYPPLAITYCKTVLEKNPSKTVLLGKAHLQWGIALITLGELQKAKSQLLKAEKLLPRNDVCLTEALEKLEAKIQNGKEVESTMWKRAFGVDTKKKETEASIEAIVNEDIRKQLEEFRMGSEEQLVLSSLMTSKESEIIMSAAKDLGLDVKVRDKSVCISKT